MPRQRHDSEFDDSINRVFSALVAVLAKRRWADGLELDDAVPIPKVGCRYVNQRDKVLRRGRVIECLRPVSLTLYETLFDPPCRVRLQLRWRVEPVEAGTLLRLDVRYQLNGAAAFRRRHWNGQIHAHCARMMAAVQSRLAGRGSRAPQGAGSNGHSKGRSSIVTANVIAVSGTPILRKSAKR